MVVFCRIEDITYRNGGSRTTSDYQKRIGSTVKMYTPTRGFPLLMEYVYDNCGNHECDKYIRTSNVVDIHYNPSEFTYKIETLNSVFYLRELESV